MIVLEQAVAQLEGSIVRAEGSNDRRYVNVLRQAQQVILEVIAAESSMTRLVASDAGAGPDALFIACMQDAAEFLVGGAAQRAEPQPKSAAKL